MMSLHARLAVPAVIALLASACDSPVRESPLRDASAAALRANGVHAFTGPVLDIDAAPDGSILVAEGATVKRIRGGRVSDVATVPTLPGAPVNGLASVGAGNFFAATGGLDLAMGAAVWRVSHGSARVIADIEAFETAEDPDAFRGTQWKNRLCEEDPAQGFSAGPQSNPYHLTALSGHEALVADAAGNSVLSAQTNGRTELVAVLTPPLDEHGEPRVLFSLGDIDCFVQPVPTSVAVGPDGAWYVGELTGVPAVPGWSRVWRIEPGSRDVVCPSTACTEVLSGLTSIIDLAFGPGGDLYVVEYDANGWLAGMFLGDPAGGVIRRCDVDSGTCVVAADGLTLPGALTFDRAGHAWVLENGPIAAVVRRIALP
jgi:hypothetical protein